jgi:hypothetical protein
MDDQPNPYESPRTESRLVSPSDQPMPHPRDGWKFILLAVAILCGLASVMPWLAIILAFISAPVFVRYFLLRRQAEGGAPPAAGTVIAGMTGAIGLGFGILAAAAGTFLGACSATTWTLVFTLSPFFPGRMYDPLGIAFMFGILLGIGAFIITLVWLPMRIWPRSSRPS